MTTDLRPRGSGNFDGLKYLRILGFLWFCRVNVCQQSRRFSLDRSSNKPFKFQNIKCRKVRYILTVFINSLFQVPYVGTFNNSMREEQQWTHLFFLLHNCYYYSATKTLEIKTVDVRICQLFIMNKITFPWQSKLTTLNSEKSLRQTGRASARGWWGVEGVTVTSVD